MIKESPDQIIGHVKEDYPALQSLAARENDVFKRDGYKHGLLAYRVLAKAVLSNRVVCFPSSVSFTHGIDNPLLTAKNNKNGLAKIYQPLAQLKTQRTTYFERYLYEPVTIRELKNLMEGSRTAWLTMQKKEVAHCIGLRYDQTNDLIMVLNTIGSLHTNRQHGQFIYLRSMNLAEFTKRLNAAEKVKSIPVRFVTFS